MKSGKMVGIAGFEPATSRPPDERANQAAPYSEETFPNVFRIEGNTLGKGFLSRKIDEFPLSSLSPWSGIQIIGISPTGPRVKGSNCQRAWSVSLLPGTSTVFLEHCRSAGILESPFGVRHLL